jgi:Zn-finger nucleic acid-binding protein
MKGSWSMSCPACGADLVLLRATLPVHACSRCGGAWLGQEASVHIAGAMEEALECDVLAPTCRDDRSGTNIVTHDAAQCPECLGTVIETQVAGLTLETCPAHGLWLDRDDVASVVAAAKTLRMAAERRSRVSTNDDLSDTGPGRASFFVLTAVARALLSARDAFAASRTGT